ncbi:MAG TPA: sulfatase, partial [Verrucomicrobiales bacterium]|nr:sulfatase [Verrucomicrobiales bacterium]
MNHSLTRRHFLQDCSTGLGAMWLAAQGHTWGATLDRAGRGPLTPVAPHHHPKAKRVIFLHMAGAPSHLELFDYKPELAKHDGQDCPESFLKGKRFAFIQGVPKLLGSQFPFERHGQSGAWVSNRLPHFSQLVDEVCFLKGMHTEQFNHAPAQLAMHTGYSTLGYPSMGAWVTYGLGSESENLPGFIVL